MTAGEFRTLLQRCDITQRELAARLGVETSSVNRWARGRTRVPKYALAYLEVVRTLRDYQVAKWGPDADQA